MYNPSDYSINNKGFVKVELIDSEPIEGVEYIPKFYNKDIYQNLQTELEWNYHNYFKRHFCHYQEGSPTLDKVLDHLEKYKNVQVLGVFANYYKDGNEYAPYHKDKYGCTVASISFGADRDFYFKHDKTGERIHYPLSNGDLLIFGEKVNDNYKHSVPKRANVDKGRICLTIFIKKS